MSSKTEIEKWWNENHESFSDSDGPWDAVEWENLTDGFQKMIISVWEHKNTKNWIADGTRIPMEGKGGWKT